MEVDRCYLLLLAVFISVAVVDGHDPSYLKARARRDLAELGNIMSSVIGESVLSIVGHYNGYGCYCGVGGKGHPVDEVDRCCQLHDQCFDTAQGACRGASGSIYSQTYQYKSINTKDKEIHANIVCASAASYAEGIRHGLCSEALCECDRAVANCLAKRRRNFRYEHYNREKC